MLFTIIGLLLFIVGLYCLIKPDNFLLPYARYGGVTNAKKYITDKGKTPQLLLFMRFFGLVMTVIGLLFMIKN